MNFKLKIWRQKDASSAGQFTEYEAKVYLKRRRFWRCWTL